MSTAPMPNQERPRPEAFAQGPTTSAATMQRPAAVQRFGNQAKGKEVAISSAAQRPPGRVYAMTQEQADTAPDVVLCVTGRVTPMKEFERSIVGQSDERTIYKVQQRRVMIRAMDYHSMQMSGGVGALDDGMVQQRLHALAMQRDALARQRDALTRQGDKVQQMEIELKAQVIARLEIMELQNSFEIRMKEQVHLAIKLQLGELTDGADGDAVVVVARWRLWRGGGGGMVRDSKAVRGKI
ncbi:hypothetical protein Drorol1_Dr00025821 [Drosera rotundifolia]